MNKNIILCHPNYEGNPVAELFGQINPVLLQMVECYGSENRYTKAHPDYIGQVDFGFRERHRIIRVERPWNDYWNDVAKEVLMKYNAADPEWRPCGDPDLAVALGIADQHMDEPDVSERWAEQEIEPLVHEYMRHIKNVPRREDDYEFEDEMDPRPSAFLEYITFQHGFVWEFECWDQEPRFIARGLVRVPGTKIVQDLDGLYTISPRCHRCGHKTGWCRCSEDLEEIMKEAKERHLCNDCCYLEEFEDALDEYLLSGKVSQRILDDLMEIARDWFPDEDDGEFFTEVHFNDKKKAAAFLEMLYEGQEGVEVLEWYEFIARFWDRWCDKQEERLSESCDGDDEGYCECPLEG